ncbi:hypothetical protein ANCDUO_13575 [Ancylostoma duodenale]|uniref:Uncharacterized protein n=1 Tax=Ancylostoma duodenale TaxID=51022 RepID=A0A0C2CIL4_9BILA|nr:hypothetical protein ANCDUO_13575 [Ancylostoma duodenale]
MKARTKEELEEANRKYAELDRMVKKKETEAQEAANRGDSKTLVSKLTGAQNMSNIPIKDRSGKPLMTDVQL